MLSPVRVSAFRDDALGADDATGVAARITAGEISPLEAVEAAISRVEAVNPELNAVAHIDYDRARERAATLHTPRGVFGGVPSATKDNIHVAGMPLTFGSAAMPRTIIDTDGPFTAQFLATGTIPICSTQTPPFGWTATTERVGGDVTRNPWNPAYSPGGSSGGTAALVAAGALPFAHGNDGGGSIRIPASACSLVGLKPTRGRTRPDPISKGMPIDLVGNGILTRSVRDTAAFLHSLEQTYRNPRLPEIGMPSGGPSRPLRVGFMVNSPVSDVAADPDTARTIEECAQTLASLGHRVEEVRPRVSRAIRTDFEDYWSLLAFSVANQGTRLFGPDFDKTALDPFTLGLSRRFVRRSPRLPLVLTRLTAARSFYQRLFRDLDVMLTPVLNHEVPKVGYLDAEQPFEEHFAKLLDYVTFTPLHNVTGAPSMSVPYGLSEGGLPIGVMLSGRIGDERTLLELAFDIEGDHPFPQISDTMDR